MSVTFHQLLKTMVERGGSELYVAPNTPPQIRIDGSFCPLDMPPLSNTEVRQMLTGFLPDDSWAEIERGNPVTHGFAVKGLARFRLSAYPTQFGGTAAVAKQIAWEILGFRELGLPDELEVVPVGLTLIGGPHGSGRSSTLAAVIDKANRERHVHITLFAPAAGTVLHQHKNSVVDQVVFTETAIGARRAAEVALWGSADIIAFDELYGVEALRTMIHIAQTGCPVVATVPGAKNARDIIEKIAALVPPYVRPSLLSELASVLRLVVAQQLLQKANKIGRVAAYEVLVVGEAAHAAIEKGQLSALDRCVADGRSMATSLAVLATKNLITNEMALHASPDESDFEALFDQARQDAAARRAARRKRS